MGDEELQRTTGLAGSGGEGCLYVGRWQRRREHHRPRDRYVLRYRRDRARRGRRRRASPVDAREEAVSLAEQRRTYHELTLRLGEGTGRVRSDRSRLRKPPEFGDRLSPNLVETESAPRAIYPNATC